MSSINCVVSIDSEEFEKQSKKVLSLLHELKIEINKLNKTKINMDVK